MESGHRKRGFRDEINPVTVRVLYEAFRALSGHALVDVDSERGKQRLGAQGPVKARIPLASKELAVEVCIVGYLLQP